MTQKRVPIFFAAVFLIFISTYFVIKFAKGYKPDFQKKTFRPTGLLVATSVPNGAQLWVNQQLKSATDTTISLPPGDYEVEIKKDGFTSWKKNLKIEKELVNKTDAYLFPQVPDLKALTFTSAHNPLLSPDGSKVIYSVTNVEMAKNGLWLLDLSEFPFGLAREPRQIVKSGAKGRDFTKAIFQWSPDSKQVLINFKTGKNEENFLVDTGNPITSTELIDVTNNLTTIFKQWQKEAKNRQDPKMEKIPEPILEVLQSSSKNLVFSPDEYKVLYAATAAATLKEGLVPTIPAASTQKQDRELIPNQIYVYDLKEDRNFLISNDPSANLSWFPTSRHLVLVEKNKITIMEYDGTNRLTVYSGPFEDSFAFPFPTGNKLLILTSLGNELPANLYAVSLR